MSKTAMTEQELEILKKYELLTEQELEILKKCLSKVERELKILKKCSSRTRNKFPLNRSNNQDLISFMENMSIDEIVGHPTNFVYIYYWYFSLTCGKEPLSQIEFSRHMAKAFGLKIVDKKIKGIKYRVFEASP